MHGHVAIHDAGNGNNIRTSGRSQLKDIDQLVGIHTHLGIRYHGLRRRVSQCPIVLRSRPVRHTGHGS